MEKFTVTVDGKVAEMTGGYVDIEESLGWEGLANYLIKTSPDISGSIFKGDEIKVGERKYLVKAVNSPNIIVTPC